MPRLEWRDANRIGFLDRRAVCQSKRLRTRLPLTWNNFLKLSKMWRLLMRVENDSGYFHWCQSPHVFSTWKIILSSKWKCFSSTFERSLFHDPFDTLALKGLSSAGIMHWACGVETSNARVPRYEPQKRAYFDTNELLRGRTNTRWASNRKMKNELRRARMSSSTNYYAGGTNTRLHRHFVWHQEFIRTRVCNAWSLHYGALARRNFK